MADQTSEKRGPSVDRIDHDTVRRQLPDGGQFDLAYVRTGPWQQPPILIFPGGPGLASLLPYQGLRKRAAKRGLQILMIEHRGIGLSRKDTSGNDLPRDAMRIDEVLADAAAVLDAEHLDKAIIYGTSYGSYLAMAFGVRYPERVAAMVLDSAMLGPRSDPSPSQLVRELYWHGTDATRQLARRSRALAEAGKVDASNGFPLQFLHEFGGLPAVDRALSQLEKGKGKGLWEALQGLGDQEVLEPRPLMMEFDLAGEIAFRELDYAKSGDDGPLRATGVFDRAAAQFSSFQGEPFNLPEQIRAFSWPTVLISGERDLRTPRSTAERIARLVPEATVIKVRDHGHSALDTAPNVALDVLSAVAAGGSLTEITARLPADPRGESNIWRIMQAHLMLTRMKSLFSR